MKKLLACLVLLVVTACIPVEDFGGYWDKGTVDKAVFGTWKRVAKKDSGDRELVMIVNHKGTYRIDSLDPKDRKQKDYQPLFAKTLQIGNYTFFMTTQGAGEKSERNLVRYQVKKGRLMEYDLQRGAMEKLVRRKYLWVKNLDVSCPNKCLVESVKIKVLDKEVVDVLAAIPDTAEFWKPIDEWRKVGMASSDKLKTPRVESKPEPRSHGSVPRPNGNDHSFEGINL
jgi:hypothetical protein